jgi:hypothetical protein
MADQFHLSPTLDAWLKRVEASEQWTMTVPNTGAKVSGYLINGNLVVAVRYAEGNGWELLIPASKENNTAATLDGAASFCGVLGCRDLPGIDGAPILASA